MILSLALCECESISVCFWLSIFFCHECFICQVHLLQHIFMTVYEGLHCCNNIEEISGWGRNLGRAVREISESIELYHKNLYGPAVVA